LELRAKVHTAAKSWLLCYYKNYTWFSCLNVQRLTQDNVVLDFGTRTESAIFPLPELLPTFAYPSNYFLPFRGGYNKKSTARMV